LNEFDLVAVVDVVVEDLPFLDLALVHFELLLADASFPDNLFDPVLEFNASVLHARVVGDAGVVTFVATSDEVYLVVLLIQVPVGRSEVSGHDTCSLSVSLELFPHLGDHLVGVRSAIFLLHQLEVVHFGLLLEAEQTVELT